MSLSPAFMIFEVSVAASDGGKQLKAPVPCLFLRGACHLRLAGYDEHRGGPVRSAP